MQNASEADIQAFEREIDAFVDGVILAQGDFADSAYQALTLVEDRPRLMTLSAGSDFALGEDDPAVLRISGQMARNVFALRHLLERLWKTKKTIPNPLHNQFSVDGEAYVRMGKAIDLFNDYQSVSHALKGYRTGHFGAQIYSGRKTLQIVPKPRHDGYDALAFCLAGSEMENPPWLINWLAWIRFKETRPEVIFQIVRSSQVSHDGRITYDFDTQIAGSLAAHLHFFDPSVPEGWCFPWGSWQTVKCLVAALHLRCLYHLCAIHFTAEKHDIEGGGVDDLCLILTKGKLVRELHKITKIPLSEIVTFVSVLIYGENTTSPDPALQPFIPLRNSLLAIPCMFVGAMRSGRNLLTLHARLNAKSFDGQSSHFERGMLNSLEKAFRAKFSKTMINVKLSKQFGGEELDILVFDPGSKSIFIAEARATIMPADPSEVYRRLTEIERKVKQLERKLASVRLNLAAILFWAGFKNVSDDWQVLGAVILRGHAGTLTKIPGLPVVPEYVVFVGLERLTSIVLFHKWLASHSWLPQPELHFKTTITTHQFGEHEVKFGGVGGLQPRAFLYHYLPKSVDSYRETS